MGSDYSSEVDAPGKSDAARHLFNLRAKLSEWFEAEKMCTPLANRDWLPRYGLTLSVAISDRTVRLLNRWIENPGIDGLIKVFDSCERELALQGRMPPKCLILCFTIDWNGRRPRGRFGVLVASFIFDTFYPSSLFFVSADPFKTVGHKTLQRSLVISSGR
jgi:hypothetical protein